MFITFLPLHRLCVPWLFDWKDCKNLKPWILPAHSVPLAVTIYCGCHIPLAGRHSLLPSVRQTVCEAGQQVAMRKMPSLASGSWAEGAVSMGATVLPGRTRSQDTGDPLAQGAEFRMGNPFWRNTYVMTQYADLHLLAFSNSFLPTFEVKADNPFVETCLSACQTG